ncbi:hypothetical protein C8A05DRAFT_15426 [Staphylotrichum tortipilum]|uniref:Uncharacterized protein n=1 Tax=Staphylotrichum tortipilum TaxID=2831512 RepID=A0AAN6MLM8_9PEZI|nr:hypothetical protein C8A05DRAFT_15426 [Staphylotrichum longicolle]
MAKPRHLRVHTECDVCAEPVLPEEPCVVLLGNANSTSYFVGIIESTQKTQLTRDAPQWHFCRAATCMACEEGSSHTCSVHAECLQVVIRRCIARDALDRLWLACAWRRQVWTGALVPPLGLGLGLTSDNRDSILGSDLSTLLDFAQRSGLRQLKVLPIEILRGIQILSRPHLFWRYITAVNLAKQLSMAPSYPMWSFPLGAVASWERGSTPRLAVDGRWHDLPPIVRLTIDVNGFKALDRLSEPPTYQSCRFDELLFITDTQSRLADITAHFKNGLLRLTLPHMDRGLQVWDTPTPPDLQRCPIRLEDTATCLRFCTINVNEISGLTFFFHNGSAMAIHAHSRKAPSASLVFGSLGDWCKSRIVWIYVPLPLGDHLTGFGCLVQPDNMGYYTININQSCFLLRSSSVGDTVVGHYRAGGEGRFIVGEGRPTTLIYSMARFRPISVISPYSNLGQTGSLIEPRGYPRPEQFPSSGWHFSCAPLGNVRRVQVFLEEDYVHCRGVLLEYEGGGQRALGQCRLLLDRAKTYDRASQIAFTNVLRWPAGSEFDLEATKVVFDEVPEGGDSWLSFGMTGTLWFWFTEKETRVEMSKSADPESTTTEE